jgi:uncharacterized membrane protein
MRETLLIIHFIGLAMGVGTSFAFLFLGRAGAKLDPEEGKKFMVNALSLTTMGHIGLGLLIISGLLLMDQHWVNLAHSPLLHVKFTLVAILLILIILLTRFGKRVKNGDAAAASMMRPLGPVALLVSLTIIVLAVLHFQ